LKVRNESLKTAKEGTSQLGGSKETTALSKIIVPDENPDLKKKHVFQKLSIPRYEEACYTLEEAAKYVPPMNRRKYYKYPTLSQITGNMDYALRSYENEHTVVNQFPDVTDILVVGGGIVGSSTAYYIKTTCNRAIDACVIDKDPYSPHNCAAISNGLISSQSKCQDVVRSAHLSKELIRCLKNDVICTNEDFAQIRYRPVTHLVLYKESQVDEVVNAVEMQLLNGCYVDTKLPDQLERTFPFLNLSGSDVALGTHGNQDEALVDPLALRNLYRTLAQAHGANFIKAEALDFNMVYHSLAPEISPVAAQAMVARIDTGELRSVHFATTLLCLGHNTPYLEAQAEMEDYHRDAYDDIHFMQPKMRLVFTFSSMDAPVINFPVITDVDGSQLICDDYCGTFKYFANIDDSEKLLNDDCEKFMDIESDEPYPNLIHKDKDMESYFHETIKPRLVRRIPCFEDAKFMFAQSGFESWNCYDGSPLLSEHPYFETILLSGGFGNRMMNFAPLAGTVFSELSLYNKPLTYDIKGYYWERVLKGVRMDEFPQLLGGYVPV